MSTIRKRYPIERMDTSSVRFVGELGLDIGREGSGVRIKRGSKKLAFYIAGPKPNEELTEWFADIFDTMNANFLQLSDKDALGIELHAPEDTGGEEHRFPYYYPIKLYSSFHVNEFIGFYERIAQSARFLTLAPQLLCIVTVIRSPVADS